MVGSVLPSRRASFRSLVAVVLTVAFATTSVTVSQGHAVPEAWVTMAPAPVGTEGASGAFIGSLFYHYDHGNLYTFDPATNTWTFISVGPGLNHEGVGAAAVGPGGPVFISFGAGGTEVYDVTSGTWTVGTTMPTPRNGLGAATVANKVYTVGGKSCVAMGCGGPGMSPAVEIYDPITNTWAIGPAMPVAVSDVYATLSRGNFVYAFGGWDGVADRADMQILNTLTMTWGLGPAMPTARGNAVAGLCGDHIYVIGGLQITGGGFQTTVERYDFQTGTWGAAPPLPGVMAEMSAGLVSDGMGNIIATTGAAAPTDTHLLRVGDCRTQTPTGGLGCRATAVHVVETDLGSGVGTLDVPYADSQATLTPTPGPLLMPMAPMDRPVAPQVTADAALADVDYSNGVLGVKVQARGLYSECDVHAATGAWGVGAHGYAHAGVADLRIDLASLGGTLLHVEALDFETNAFGTTAGVDGFMACDLGSLLVAGTLVAAVCQSASFSIGGLGVDVWVGEQAMPAPGYYDGSVLHVRVTQPGVTQVDVYVGHTTVDLSAVSAAATPPVYVPNSGCLTICT